MSGVKVCNITGPAGSLIRKKLPLKPFFQTEIVDERALPGGVVRFVGPRVVLVCRNAITYMQSLGKAKEIRWPT